MRHPPLPVLLLAILLLAACTTGPTPGPVPGATTTPQPTGVFATNTPPGTPSPDLPALPDATPALVRSSACEDAPRARLIVLERGLVSTDDTRPLNVRAAPGLAAAIDWQLQVGAVFLVTDGPRCADGYTWFEIRAGERSGWIAEGEPGLYFVEPFLPG